MKKYYKEDLEIDVDWLVGLGFNECEARKFVLSLMNREFVNK